MWDALVDPVLVEGWLHPQLRLVDGTTVHERVEPSMLDVESAELGRLRITLAEVPGGTRGTSTGIVIEVLDTVDARFTPPITAGWQTRLDQLESLLRGHPVDWENWERDHGDDYRAYLNRA